MKRRNTHSTSWIQWTKVDKREKRKIFFKLFPDTRRLGNVFRFVRANFKWNGKYENAERDMKLNGLMAKRGIGQHKIAIESQTTIERDDVSPHSIEPKHGKSMREKKVCLTNSGDTLNKTPTKFGRTTCAPNRDKNWWGRNRFEKQKKSFSSGRRRNHFIQFSVFVVCLVRIRHIPTRFELETKSLRFCRFPWTACTMNLIAVALAFILRHILNGSCVATVTGPIFLHERIM